MVKKINIKESVNTMNDSIYDNLALLGYTCSLAANDLHHIHLCATGDKFQEIHECADKYLGDVRELIKLYTALLAVSNSFIKPFIAVRETTPSS